MELRTIVSDSENRLIINDGECFVELTEAEDGSLNLDFSYPEHISQEEADEFSQTLYGIIVDALKDVGEQDDINPTPNTNSE